MKNIYRLFRDWLKKHYSPEMEMEGILHALLQSIKKYNNSLVVAISKNSKLRSAFLLFAEDEGEKLIGSSRIFDKASHVEALKTYRQLCLMEESSESEEIK